MRWWLFTQNDAVFQKRVALRGVSITLFIKDDFSTSDIHMRDFFFFGLLKIGIHFSDGDLKKKLKE